jgi:hypothetical protein
MLRYLSRVLSLGTLVLACKPAPPQAPPSHTQVPPPPSQTATPSTDSNRTAWDGQGEFRLRFSDFHFEVGEQLFLASSDGLVRELFSTHELVQTAAFCRAAASEADRTLCAEMQKAGEDQFGRMRWHVAAYTLTPAALAAGRAALAGVEWATLKKSYSNSKVPDGTTHGYRFLSSAGLQTVSTYASAGPSPAAPEPAKLLLVLRWIEQQQREHRSERDRAPDATALEQSKLRKEWLTP